MAKPDPGALPPFARMPTPAVLRYVAEHAVVLTPAAARRTARMTELAIAVPRDRQRVRQHGAPTMRRDAARTLRDVPESATRSATLRHEKRPICENRPSVSV